MLIDKSVHPLTANGHHTASKYN